MIENDWHENNDVWMTEKSQYIYNIFADCVLFSLLGVFNLIVLLFVIMRYQKGGEKKTKQLLLFHSPPHSQSICEAYSNIWGKNGRLWRTWAKNCNNCRVSYFSSIYMVRGNSVSLISTCLYDSQSAGLSAYLAKCLRPCGKIPRLTTQMHVANMHPCIFIQFTLNGRCFLISDVAIRFFEQFQ